MNRLEECLCRAAYGLAGFAVAWLPLYFLCNAVKDPEASWHRLLLTLSSCTFLMIVGASMVADSVLGKDDERWP